MGMGQERKQSSNLYQLTVSAAGLAVWLIALAGVISVQKWSEQVTLIVLLPVIVVGGMFAQHFRLPLGLKFTRERITFTLTDALVLLVICWFGPYPAIFLAGVEGYTSSRRTVRSYSS